MRSTSSSSSGLLRRWSPPAALIAVLVAAASGVAPGPVVLAQQGAQPRANPLMPPERELAMKVKGSFTFAGVGDIIIRHPFAELAEPGFRNLIQSLRSADVAFANMEGTVIDYASFPDSIGNGQPKTLLADLKTMGIRMMNTANNHSMDSGESGIFETMQMLDSAGIAHAGTGRHLQEARAPAFVNTPKGIVGLVGVFSIGHPEFQPRVTPTLDNSGAAGDFLTSGASYKNGDRGGTPGVNPLHVTPIYSLTAEELAALRKTRDAIYTHRNEVPGPVPAVSPNEPKDLLYSFGQWYKAGGKPGEITYHMNRGDLNEILRSVRLGKQYADFMVVTIHCHQNNYIYQQYGFDYEVPDFLQEFAHKAIDNGADVFIGHGVHTIRPVEIYKGKPIFYGVSQFVWQLPQASLPQNPGGDTTDAENTFRPGSEMDRINLPENLESFLVETRFENGQLAEVRLHPVDLGQDHSRPFSRRGIPMVPSPDMATRVLEKVQKLSAPYGTTIAIENGVGVIRMPAQ